MAYGNDSNTVLLIHSNNVNGSQLFSDASQAGNGGNRHALTAVGNIAHSTATTKLSLGSSTVSCNTSGYLSIPAHADFDYGSGDFTIDLWFYAHALSDFNVGIIGWYIDASNYFSLELNGTTLRLNTKSNGVSLLSKSYLIASLLSIETWYHTAVVRNGSQITLYLNGVQKDTATVVTNPPQYNAPLLVGKKSDNTFGGHWTELRISKGVARSDFPVTFPYTSANQSVILTIPSASLFTPQFLGSSLTASVASACDITNSIITRQTLNQVSSVTSYITNYAITSANVSASNSSSGTLTNNTIAAGDLDLATGTAITTLNTSVITSFQVNATADSVANIIATDTSARIDIATGGFTTIAPSDVISAAINSTTESSSSLNIELSGQQVNATFSSVNAITTTAIAEGELYTNFISLASIQNSAPLPIEFNQTIRMASAMPLQLGIVINFDAEIRVTLIIIPTLTYTSRQNIVLKIKEGLYGGVTIAGVNYEVAQVEGTTDFRGLLTEDQVSSTPSIFVAYSQTRASDNQVLGFNTRQQVEDYFAVFLVADNITDEYGINAMDLIRAMRRLVLDSLLNWQLPPTQYDLPMMPLVYRGGNAYGLESDSYYWRDDYSCTSQICSLQSQPMF